MSRLYIYLSSRSSLPQLHPTFAPYRPHPLSCSLLSALPTLVLHVLYVALVNLHIYLHTVPHFKAHSIGHNGCPRPVPTPAPFPRPTASPAAECRPTSPWPTVESEQLETARPSWSSCITQFCCLRFAAGPTDGHVHPPETPKPGHLGACSPATATHYFTGTRGRRDQVPQRGV